MSGDQRSVSRSGSEREEESDAVPGGRMQITPGNLISLSLPHRTTTCGPVVL